MAISESFLSSLHELQNYINQVHSETFSKEPILPAERSRMDNTLLYLTTIESTHPDFEGVPKLLNGYFTKGLNELNKIPINQRTSFVKFLEDKEYPKLQGGIANGEDPCWWVEVTESEYLGFDKQILNHGDYNDGTHQVKFEDGFRRFLILSLNMSLKKK